jgi:ABC-type multidrug transport system fused ATPase/permease subunit
VIFLGIASFTFAIGAYSASTKVHSSLVHTLMRLPIAFYDRTPLGRIMNRVSHVR